MLRGRVRGGRSRNAQFLAHRVQILWKLSLEHLLSNRHFSAARFGHHAASFEEALAEYFVAASAALPRANLGPMCA